MDKFEQFIQDVKILAEGAGIKCAVFILGDGKDEVGTKEQQPDGPTFDMLNKLMWQRMLWPIKNEGILTKANEWPQYSFQMHSNELPDPFGPKNIASTWFRIFKRSRLEMPMADEIGGIIFHNNNSFIINSGTTSELPEFDIITQLNDPRIMGAAKHEFAAFLRKMHEILS